MNHFVKLALVVVVLITSSGCTTVKRWIWGSGAKDTAAQEVPLTRTAIEYPEAILAPADFDQNKAMPVICYSGIVIPWNRLGFSPTEVKKTVTIGGKDFVLLFSKEDGFALRQDRKTTPIKIRRHGLEPVQLNLGGGRTYTLALPRSITYSDNGAVWYRGGDVMAGTLDGNEIALYDNDTDGAYGLRRDAIRLGKPDGACVFAPISTLLATTSGVYRIEKIAPDGSSLTCRPYEGDTARLVVRFDGAWDCECHLALASEDGTLTCAVVATGQTLVVPPGRYKILFGSLYSPATRNVEWLILPGESQMVEALKNATPPAALVVGGGVTPRFSHEVRLEDDKVKVYIGGPLTLIESNGLQYAGQKVKLWVSVQSAQQWQRLGQLTLNKFGGGGASFVLPVLDAQPGVTNRLTLEGDVPRVGGSVGWDGWNWIYGERQRPPFARVGGSVVLTGVDAVRDALLAKLASAPPAARASLIRSTPSVACDKALGLVRDALKADAPEVREAALDALGRWPNAASMDALLQAAQDAADDKVRTSALKSYLRAVQLPSPRSPEQTVKALASALSAARLPEEKGPLLKAVARVISPAALDALLSQIADEAVGAHAAGLCLEAAKGMLGTQPDAAKAALQRILEAAKDDRLKKAAAEALAAPATK